MLNREGEVGTIELNPKEMKCVQGLDGDDDYR